MMFMKEDSRLIGIKFLDSENKNLVKCGLINSSSYRTDPTVELREVTLEEGERLVGVKFGQRGYLNSEIYDF